MTKISEKIFLGFDKGVALESIRQWLVLIALVSLCVLYIFNTYQLIRIYKRLNFEIIIISSSVMRLVLLFFHEFIVPDIFIIFLSM